MRLSKKQAFVGLLALAGAGYGCKDFLVTQPQGSLDALTLANAAGVDATLTGAYRPIGSVNGWLAAPSNWVYGNVTSGDTYKGSEASDQGDINPIERYDWGSGGAHNVLNNKWSTVYEGISRSNATLNLLAQVQKDKPAEIPDAMARSIRGEALFLRAHYHFEAWKFWGNIPYYTEADTDFRKANTGTDPLPLILKDLDEAISLLPPTPRNGQKGRASQWTAKAYKGRVHAFMASMGLGGVTWATARQTLQDVVQNGPYALEANFHRVWTGFHQFANGPETILAFQASINDGNPDGANSNDGERLNFPHSGSPLGCCGFNQPTQNLVNFFRVGDNGLPLALVVGDLTPLSAGAAWNAPFDANFTAADKFPVDPRLDWTVGRDGVPYKDWGIHNSTLGWVRDVSFGGPYNGKKHVHERSSGAQSSVGWNSQHLNGVNIHILRYADVLLMLAEAEVELGNLDAARNIVNQIRRRAAQVVQGPGTDQASIAIPMNDPRVTWANYQVGEYASFPNQAYARSAVRYERRLELAMEGHLLFDQRRWNVYQAELNEYVNEEKTRRPHLTAAVAVTERHKWFPIPNRQLELSVVGEASRLTQTPGW